MYYGDTLDKKKVGQVLKNNILDKYGTIIEYARQTGQVYQTVHSWTSGERLPELEDMVANCNILDIPLEYALVGTNLSCNYRDYQRDEYREEARYKYPNIIFQDIALIIPLLDARSFLDIVDRVSDCSDSFYVFKLFRHHIRTDSEAWKYCIYVLQHRSSPLVIGIEKMVPKSVEFEQWFDAYEKRKSDYIEKRRKLYTAIDMLLETGKI